jgi:hypothetical protein
MRTFIKRLTLYALLCLSFNSAAQYTQLKKGEASPYDLGVVIELSEYRRVRTKVSLSDSLISSLRVEISKAYLLIGKQDSASFLEREIISSLTRTTEGQRETIASVSADFDEMNHKFESYRRRTNRKIIFFSTTGAIVGVILVEVIKSIF